MPDTFTPEQISQILEEFFRVVGTRQYIGARYVPIFGRKDEDSIEWDNTAPYEPLTIVLYQGNSYTSRQYVPVGVEITNQEFWSVTGNYNAQVEQYRRETQEAAEAAAAAQESADAAQESADAAQESADAAQDDIDTLLPKSAFDATRTVNDALNAIGALLPASDFSASATVKQYVDAQLADNSLNSYHPLTYFGRVVPLAHWLYRYGQGICLLDDTTALVTCTSVSANLAYIYRVDISSGVVVDIMQSEIGHANDMFYDREENVVLVAPSSFAGVPSNDILICSPSTMAILRRVSLDIRPASIFKYDNEYYVCAIQSNVVDIYKYDSSFTNGTLFASIDSVNTGNDSVAQRVRIFNDEIYVLYGGYESQAIYAFDTDGDMLGRIDFDRNVEYFNVTEFEGFDFTSNGDVILYAQCNIAGIYGFYCNAIFGINISGMLLNPKQIVVPNATQANLRISNIENNYNRFIRPNGSNSAQFPSIEEAAACASSGGGSAILLDTDAYWCGKAPIIGTMRSPLYINGNGHTIYAGLPFAGTEFYGAIPFGITCHIFNATVKSSAVTPNLNLRFYDCTFHLKGNSVIDFSNSTNVAPLRFDNSVVLIDTTVTKDEGETTYSILMNKSLLVTPNNNFSYSGQLARVQ